MVLLSQMTTLFLFMIIGLALRRKGVLGPGTCKDISWLIIHIANPCLTLSGAISSEKALTGAALRTTFLLCIYVYSILIAVSLILPVILRVPKERRGTWQAMMAFSNIGFMGLPLLRVLYGAGSLVYATLFTMLFALLFYSYGAGSLRSERRYRLQKEQGEAQTAKGAGSLLPLILNVGTIAGFLALFIAFRKPPIPAFAASAVEHLGALPTSMSMLVIGASLAEIPLRDLFTDVRLLIFAFVKLLLVPVAALLILKQFITDPLFLGICLVMLSTPTASMVAMMAHQYDADYSLASRGIALTTILAVGTMPLVSLITGI